MIHNYEILDEIGVGGMSRVYRARPINGGDPVAIKVIHIENIAADFEARLQREPEIQRGLGHENIVELIESFRERDEFFLVMEYIDGRSLARMIARETGPLPFERARGYFRQILRAVDHLHRLGIIHRDIKPSNIMIGWDNVVKLADFGIAKYTWQQAQTNTQRGLGTPEYMSPEQARGTQIDFRTDVYSLGITLFEVLTARKPFMREESTPMAYVEVIQEIMTKPLPDPRAFNPSVSDDVVRLLRKATAKDPDERFQSCAEFLGALEIVGSEPASLSPPGAFRDGRDPSATVVGAGGSISSTGSSGDDSSPTIVLPAGSPTRVAPAPVTPSRRVAEPRRRSILPWVLLTIAVLAIGGYFGYKWYMEQQTARQNVATGPSLTTADAMRVSLALAADVRRFQAAGNSAGLASLYGEKGVTFYSKSNATRAFIKSDLEKFHARMVRTDQYNIDVKGAKPLSDSTIETDWEITYQRLRNDGTMLRGTVRVKLRLRRIDDVWYIVSEKEVWAQRKNIEPPKVDSTSDQPEVVDIPAQTPSVTDAQKLQTVERFLERVQAGDVEGALDESAASSVQSRRPFVEWVTKQKISSISTWMEGDRVVASVKGTGEGDVATDHRLLFTVVDENGPKIKSIEIK